MKKKDTVDNDIEEAFADIYTKFKLHFYREVFKNWDNREATLTTVESFCMEVIYALKRPTVNEFASFVRISSPNAAYKINNLVKKGYLRRVQSETDRREYYLEPTDKYLAYYNIASAYMYKTIGKTRSRLDKEQQKGALELFRIILEEMNADMPELEKKDKNK